MATKKRSAKKNVAKPPTAMEVLWKKRSEFTDEDAPAQAAYKEIVKIQDSHGGQVEAEQIVEYGSAHPRSVMNKLIGKDGDWDDGVAAHKHRLAKARSILRSIHIVSDGQTEPVRAFHVDATRSVPSRKGQYRPTQDILADPDSRAALMQRALNELVTFQRRYRALQELGVVIRGIDEFLESYHSEAAK